MIEFICDMNGASEPLAHFWEHTVGSGHATLALRADWQKQLERCHRELGFQYVRFHGLLSDDMGTLVCEMEQLVYSFFNADQVFDFLQSIGMRPFVELSFMPTILSSGPDIVFHYRGNITPPKDYTLWANLIRRLADHWVKRYGIDELRRWFFEVWNEPNLSAFWTGTQAEYFNLFKYSFDAIKRVHPDLRVGGPATAENAWISEFLDFCEANQISPDFVSTHHYPTDAFGKPGDDTIAQLAASKRSVLRDQVVKTKSQARGKPVYYTEWSTSSNPFDELHDLPYAAAYIVKTVLEARGIVEMYSYWTFSDIFEENYFSSLPFHGGFGLQTIYGIPKPAYRAYELLHRLGEEMFQVQGGHPTVDVWVIKSGDRVHVVACNSALPLHPIANEEVEVRIQSTFLVKSAFIERIDDEHANPQAVWKKMGSPDSLSPAEVETLERESLLVRESFVVKIENNSVILNVTIPPQGIVCITLEL
jgi:xylan 1,4-beta-xylosidase